jgi:hypothetical protein
MACRGKTCDLLATIGQHLIQLCSSTGDIEEISRLLTLFNENLPLGERARERDRSQPIKITGAYCIADTAMTSITVRTVRRTGGLGDYNRSRSARVHPPSPAGYAGYGVWYQSKRNSSLSVCKKHFNFQLIDLNQNHPPRR